MTKAKLKEEILDLIAASFGLILNQIEKDKDHVAYVNNDIYNILNKCLTITFKHKKKSVVIPIENILDTEGHGQPPTVILTVKFKRNKKTDYYDLATKTCQIGRRLKEYYKK